MVDPTALYTATEQALHEAETIVAARRALARQFPGEPDWLLGEMITAALGGDVVVRGQSPAAGSLREKFWRELTGG